MSLSVFFIVVMHVLHDNHHVYAGQRRGAGGQVWRQRGVFQPSQAHQSEPDCDERDSTFIIIIKLEL